MATWHLPADPTTVSSLLLPGDGRRNLGALSCKVSCPEDRVWDDAPFSMILTIFCVRACAVSRS
jgi:hypothetical protein